MSQMYGEQHRAFQDTFETRKLADTVEGIIVHSEVIDEDKAFIESRDMFFLSTIDYQGRPSVSYKGGEKGFVRVIDNTTLAFPSYDGNGMFLSMGNIKGNHNIGLLFIDFENPHRLRAYGEASVTADDPLLNAYHEAQLIVRVRVTQMWKNCPRYIHRHQRLETSKYVPRANCDTPMPDWKRLDKIQPALAPCDQGKAEAQGGVITIDALQKIERRDD